MNPFKRFARQHTHSAAHQESFVFGCRHLQQPPTYLSRASIPQYSWFHVWLLIRAYALISQSAHKAKWIFGLEERNRTGWLIKTTFGKQTNDDLNTYICVVYC